VVEPVITTAATAPTEAMPPAASASAAASAPAAVVASAGPVATPAASTAVPSPVPAAPAASGPLQLRAKAESWVEVQDAHSRVLLSRHLKPGETIQLDGTFPMRVKIGNAGATELVLRGQLLDLAASTRDNVARLELK
jgi:cytoskeleton protein RodZ